MHPLARFVVDVPDFPQPGILFRDITPLLRSHFQEAVAALDALWNEREWSEADAVAGVESRGFILAAALAEKRGKGFVPVRKKGKLPPPVVERKYDARVRRRRARNAARRRAAHPRGRRAGDRRDARRRRGARNRRGLSRAAHGRPDRPRHREGLPLPRRGAARRHPLWRNDALRGSWSRWRCPRNPRAFSRRRASTCSTPASARSMRPSR